MESPSFGEWSAAHEAQQTTGAAQDDDWQHADDVMDYAGEFRDGGDMLLRRYDDPDDEFLDPVTRELIVDPVVGSDGNTYDRLTAHKLAVHGSRMPCAGGRVFLGPDNLHFRKRLRRAHPKTDDVMRRQRQMCLESGQAALAAEDFDAALYWFALVRTWAPSSLQTEIVRCLAANAVPALPEAASDDSHLDDIAAAIYEARDTIPVDPKRSIQAFDAILTTSLPPGLREAALYFRATANTQLDHWEAAIVDFGLLLDMNPAHADAHYGRALAHSTLGHHQAAIECCEAAMQLATDNTRITALTLRGHQKACLNDYKGAKEDYDAAVAMDPASPDALLSRGLFRLDGGKLQGAIADLRALLRVDPDNEPAAEKLQEALRQLPRSKGRRSH